ncbi:MAG: hypothetical protein Q9216_003867 [Gyalolechia sp. 2 TL-2023]
MASCSNVFDRSFAQSSRVGSVLHNTEAPWTAARCQRLLRPLSSKIALLRREKQCTIDAEELQQVHSVMPNTERYDVTFNSHPRRRLSEKVKPADEEWAPNPRPRKRIKRTYSSRNLTSQTHDKSHQCGEPERSSQTRVEITVPTDFLQGQRQPDVEADAPLLEIDNAIVGNKSHSHMKLNADHGGYLWKDRPRCNYRVKLPFQWKLTDGICKGVEALLRATERHKASPRGARDLFSTCLRNVPDYIAQEELWYKTEDPESGIDVSAIIYSDIESLSTSGSLGWGPLRQIVRAHGIRIVGDAVRDGTVGINITRGIIALCIRLKAYDEAEKLLRCLFDLIKPFQNQSTAPEKTRSTIKILDDFVEATGRHSFRYKTMAWLLGSGRLPLDWIARHEMIEVWNKVVQSVTQQDDHSAMASELLRLAATIHYGLPGDHSAVFIHAIRLQRLGHYRSANQYITDMGYKTNWPKSSWISVTDNEPASHGEKTAMTISSLMTVLCAIGLLRSAANLAESGDLPVPYLTALQDIAVDAQQTIELDSGRLFRVRKDHVAVPLLAAGLVQATRCQSQQAFLEPMPAFFDRLMSLNRDGFATEEGGFFLCAVADCCAKATAEDVFDHTQKIVQHIQRIADSLKPVSSSHEMCSRIGVATALEYADSTKHPKHLHWALDVEQAVTGAHLDPAQRTPAKTPLRGQAQSRSRNGYRWEAGICEWVAKTPAIALPRPRRAQAQAQQEAHAAGVDHDERSSHRDASGVSRDSSPHLSNRRSKAASVGGLLQKHRVSQRIKHSEACKPARTNNAYVRSKYFSHVYVEDEDDELSMSEWSQEAQAQRTKDVGRITSATSQMSQGGMKKRPRCKPWKHGGSRGQNLFAESMYCVDDHEPQEQGTGLSEDELSFL